MATSSGNGSASSIEDVSLAERLARRFSGAAVASISSSSTLPGSPKAGEKRKNQQQRRQRQRQQQQQQGGGGRGGGRRRRSGRSSNRSSSNLAAESRGGDGDGDGVSGSGDGDVISPDDATESTDVAARLSTSGYFVPKHAAQPGDYLDINPDDTGQTFEEFLAEAPSLLDPYRPDHVRRTIYLQPIGTFPKSALAGSPDLGYLRRLVSAYYTGMKVVLRKPWPLHFKSTAMDATTKPSRTKKRQKTKKNTKKRSRIIFGAELTTPAGVFDIEARSACEEASSGGGLERQVGLNGVADALLWKLPKDAWCVMGVTWEDLFEEPEDIFIMGRAWGGSRVGLLSFRRYHPDCPGGSGPLSLNEGSICSSDDCGGGSSSSSNGGRSSSGGAGGGGGGGDGGDSGASVVEEETPLVPRPTTPSARQIVTYRAAKTLTHELGHCFLLDHCIRYECLMNGTANLDEDDRAPSHVCPVCVCKLTHALRCDAAERYERLAEVYADAPIFAAEAAFVRKCAFSLRS